MHAPIHGSARIDPQQHMYQLHSCYDSHTQRHDQLRYGASRRGRDRLAFQISAGTGVPLRVVLLLLNAADGLQKWYTGGTCEQGAHTAADRTRSPDLAMPPMEQLL